MSRRYIEWKTDGGRLRVEDIIVVDVLQQNVDGVLLHRELIDIHRAAGATVTHQT